jgi:hypothetical protein
MNKNHIISYFIKKFSQPVISVLGRQRQEVHDFEASLDYIMSFRSAWTLELWDLLKKENDN